MMKSTFLLLITISLHALSYARLGRSGVTYNVPKFGRQFISKYSLPDLGDDVCRLTEEIVSLQQNCIDCMKNISSVLITENGNKMYIGAKSLLLSVDMETCITTNNLPYIGSVSGCENQWECGNYLTKILTFQQNLLVACGTNYGNPEAILISHDLKMQEKEDLPRFCSQSPFWDSSYLQTDQHMFIGVNQNAYSSVITKYNYPKSRSLSSIGAVTTSEQWLNEAKFMTSFENGNFVYFVMREGNERDGYKTAIGRVCKNDPGHSDSDSDQNVYSDNVNNMFLSFTKTYITCKMALSEKQTLEFKVVSAATFNPQTKKLYATFTQYLNVDIGGYAICGFDLTEMDDKFAGEYLTTDESGKEVTRHLGNSNNCEEFRMFHEANGMYVTSGVVQQNTLYPIYYELKKFTAVLSDTVGDFTILYVGTNTGTVEKLVITSDNKLIPTSEFIVAESHIPISTMQFLNEENRMLVATTQESVARFPISQCGGHTELERCIGIRDPHCCWCETSHACSNINDCDRCVNDPETGLVSQAFGRLASYEWRKEEGCVAVCPSTEETCTRGEKIIKYLKVYPTIQESRRDVVNCTYTGVWRRDGPVSQNVTVSDTSNQAKFASPEDGRLYKILSLCFGCLFVVSLVIIVFLMCYKARSLTSRGTPATFTKRKSFIDRTNSTNIISDKPISYMTNPKKLEGGLTTPMMPYPQRMIMPEDVTKVNNSPYRSDMTAEDEGLLQVHLGRRDHSENMYSDVHNHNAQTLPRNFGQVHTLDRRQPTLQNYSQTLARQSPQQYNYNHSNTNNLNINQDLMRYVPGQNILS